MFSYEYVNARLCLIWRVHGTFIQLTCNLCAILSWNLIKNFIFFNTQKEEFVEDFVIGASHVNSETQSSTA